MEKGPIIFILILIAVVCYLKCSDLPCNYTKLEEIFDGCMNKCLVRFEFEKSLLHTIIYGASNRGKTYFVKQYLKLYREDEEEQTK